MVESDVSLDKFCELDGVTCTRGRVKKSRVFLVLFESRGMVVGWEEGAWTRRT